MKCKINLCPMQMCIGARFDGLCEVHYVCFKHRKAFRQGCNCTFCHDVRKQISMKRIGSLNCAILTDVEKRIKIAETTSRNDRFRVVLKRKATPAEKIVICYLNDIGVKYVFQKGFYNPWHIITDFYFHDSKIILEVDGGYHKNQTEKDKRRDAAFFKVRGFRTVRITNEDVFSGRFKVILVSEGVLKSSSSV